MTSQFTTHIQVNEELRSCRNLSKGLFDHTRCTDICSYEYANQVMDGIKKWCFICKNCEYYETDNIDWRGWIGGEIIEPSKIKKYPKRCQTCNIEYCRWKRGKDQGDKFLDRFSWKRHRFPKMFTFGMPGVKHVNDLIDYRAQLRTGFNNLRKSKFWTKNVDGGMWFYEVTTNIVENQSTLDGSSFPSGILTGTLNPHMHCLLLTPNKIDMSRMNDELLSRGLGRGHIQAPPEQQTTRAALGYFLNYMKKDTQLDGRNRGSFGILRG